MPPSSAVGSFRVVLAVGVLGACRPAPGLSPDPLQLVATSPTAGTIDVRVNVTPTATFSRDVDPSHLPEGSVALSELTHHDVVEASVNVEGPTVTVVPLEPLAPGKTYGLFLTTDIQDVTGVGLDRFQVVVFDTVGALTVTGTTPATGSTGVGVDTELVVTFSADLDPETPSDVIQVHTDRQVQGGTTIPGSVVVDGNKARFVSSAGSWNEYETTYTVTLDRARIHGAKGEPLITADDVTFRTSFLDAQRKYALQTEQDLWNAHLDILEPFGDDAWVASMTPTSWLDHGSHWSGDDLGGGDWALRNDWFDTARYFTATAEGPASLEAPPTPGMPTDDQVWQFVVAADVPSDWVHAPGDSPYLYTLQTRASGDALVLTAPAMADRPVESLPAGLEAPSGAANQRFWMSRLP